ncbi:hypothetical protein K491DRAFT_691634 [Lophiostoma macrostomum CBS 122681]|uniref:Uncharacterized protein n=1 Tax=Lophiostoma macrostomum CBS 122681 TaxID=1314788 RepID=A0A6A6TAE2_9PLEO|nr:hypothetical protein K491DRAFT_691634 [Lophiostoma macrostomum CBS 122681]
MSAILHCLCRTPSAPQAPDVSRSAKTVNKIKSSMLNYLIPIPMPDPVRSPSISSVVCPTTPGPPTHPQSHTRRQANFPSTLHHPPSAHPSRICPMQISLTACFSRSIVKSFAPTHRRI